MEVRQDVNGLIIAGAENMGKSYWTEKWAARCGRPVFLYNAGNDGFADYKELVFLTPDEQADHLKVGAKERRQFLYNARACDFFSIEGKVYNKRDFTKAMHKHKRVKHYGILTGKADKDFFALLDLYAKGIAVIFDDCRAIFRHGLKDHHIFVLGRKAHTGRHISPGFNPKKRGVEVALIFHNLDRVNDEMFDYTTHLVMFYVRQEPNDNIENKLAKQSINTAYQFLNQAPRYTHCIIPLKGEEEFKIKTFNAQGQPIPGPKQ